MTVSSKITTLTVAEFHIQEYLVE